MEKIWAQLSSSLDDVLQNDDVLQHILAMGIPPNKEMEAVVKAGGDLELMLQDCLTKASEHRLLQDLSAQLGTFFFLSRYN